MIGLPDITCWLLTGFYKNMITFYPFYLSGQEIEPLFTREQFMLKFKFEIVKQTKLYKMFITIFFIALFQIAPGIFRRMGSYKKDLGKGFLVLMFLSFGCNDLKQ